MAALFGGDLVRFRERHHRHLTFRAVANSPRLAISACSLRDALRVLAQRPTLPRETLTLSYSLQRALLREPDPGRKARLALRALVEGATGDDVVGWTRDGPNSAVSGNKQSYPPSNRSQAFGHLLGSVSSGCANGPDAGNCLSNTSHNTQSSKRPTTLA